MTHLEAALAILANFEAQNPPNPEDAYGLTDKTDQPPPPGADFDAQLAAFELRAAAIRERRGVPKPEAERLAYRELIDRLDGAEPSPPLINDRPGMAIQFHRELEGDLGRALRFLAGELKLGLERERGEVQEWADRNGISESDLLGAAAQLGVTRTLDGTRELWRIENR